MIPNRNRCKGLQYQYNMLTTVEAHSDKVAAISLYLGNKLQEKGYDINPKLCFAGGLLHDITKTHQLVVDAVNREDRTWLQESAKYVRGFYQDISDQWGWMEENLFVNKNERHDSTAYKLLHYEGHREVARILKNHDNPKIEISNAGIIAYADAVVDFDTIVPIDKRFERLLKGNTCRGLRNAKERSKELEQLLLSTAKITFEKHIKHL